MLYGQYRSYERNDHAQHDVQKQYVDQLAALIGAVALDDEPGRAADAIGILSEEGISIAYLYSFLLGGKGVLVFRTDNNERALEALQRGNMDIIREKDLSKLTI